MELRRPSKKSSSNSKVMNIDRFDEAQKIREDTNSFLLQVKGTHIKCKVMHFSACASETLVGSTRISNSETAIILEFVTLALGFGPV